MEAILLGIYAFFVWLVFIRLKWLPWNTQTQVIVVIIPIVGMAALILTLNVVAPSSPDVRVFKYTVAVVPQVRGRVIEVPVEEGNRLVRRGDVLFRIDPTPYRLEVAALEAQLANAAASQREVEQQLRAADGRVLEVRASAGQADARIAEVTARLELARRRVAQFRDLAASGAGNRFDLEQAETSVRELEGQLDGARGVLAQSQAAEVQASAARDQVRQKLGARVNGEFAQVAQVRAQLEAAQWNLEQTTVRSPCDCTVINLSLRPGAFTAAFPASPVMTLVEAEGQIIALFRQNELHQVKPGDEAEFALRTLPGRIIKARVDSIIWAQGAGQLQVSGTLPMTGAAAAPPQRFAVKFDVAERDRELFLAAGASGDAAIYTHRGHAIHVMRKVILRVGSITNYLIPKLH